MFILSIRDWQGNDHDTTVTQYTCIIFVADEEQRALTEKVNMVCLVTILKPVGCMVYSFIFLYTALGNRICTLNSNVLSICCKTWLAKLLLPEFWAKNSNNKHYYHSCPSTNQMMIKTVVHCPSMNLIQ